jgi:hypothetical protein
MKKIYLLSNTSLLLNNIKIYIISKKKYKEKQNLKSSNKLQINFKYVFEGEDDVFWSGKCP